MWVSHLAYIFVLVSCHICQAFYGLLIFSKISMLAKFSTAKYESRNTGLVLLKKKITWQTIMLEDHSKLDSSKKRKITLKFDILF
jgi:hypothetical protein